jgi:large subunit ribosomal protein L9
MQIILLESLNKLGKAGDIVVVKDGYANNFLIPEKKAIIANKKNKDELEGRMAEINTNNKKKIENAETIKSKIDGTSIKINIEANDEGILYGSITQKQIAEAFNSKGIEIKSDMVALTPIKSLGEFEIKIKHYEEVESQIKVLIIRKS